MQTLASPRPFIQIEITTVCNFSCRYCAGRDMPQRHMEPTVFEAILAAIRDLRGATVSLQGEGEPTLHPLFWDWTGRLRDEGFPTYTITNGSRIDAARFARELPRVGVSLDTLDVDEAERLGRHNLSKVLQNLDDLLQHMGAERIAVHSVHFGQNLAPLAAYLKSRGIRRHIVQPLQVKDDYAARYSGSPFLRLLRERRPAVQTYRCSYLDGDRMRYFDIDGTAMPCCFIKNASLYQSAEHLRQALAARTVPRACAGCRELR